MYAKTFSQFAKSNASKRFFASKSESINVSEASTSMKSPNTGFGNMTDELKTMKKDMKNQDKDFPKVRENSQLENAANLTKDSLFDNRNKTFEQKGASDAFAMDTKKETFQGVETSENSFNKSQGRLTGVDQPASAAQHSGNKTSTLNGQDAQLGDSQRNMNLKSQDSSSSSKNSSNSSQQSYRNEEEAKKAKQEDTMVHKAENFVVDTIDSMASKSKYADGKKSEEVGDGIFSKFSNGVKKAQDYYKDTTNPEYYAKRYSQVARDMERTDAEKQSTVGDVNPGAPLKVTTGDQLNWGQENNSSTGSASKSGDSGDSLASQATSAVTGAASTLKDAAKGAFDKVKDTVNDMTSSKKQ